jgi:hypothetical protein
MPSFTAEPSFFPEVSTVLFIVHDPVHQLFFSTLYCISYSNRMLCRWLLNIYPVADRLITSAVAPLSFLKPIYQIQAWKKVLQLKFIYLFKCNLLPSCLPFVPFNFMVTKRTQNFGDSEIQYELHVLYSGRFDWKIMLFHILSCIDGKMCALWGGNSLVTVHTSHHPTLQHHDSYNRTENHRQSDLLMMGVKTPETCWGTIDYQ